jgi:hypothetical protein
MRRSSVFAAVWSSVAALSALLVLAPALTAGQAAPAAKASKLLTPAALTAKAPALFKATGRRLAPIGSTTWSPMGSSAASGSSA